MIALQNMTMQLNRRRQDLRMSYSVVAQRAGLGQRTVQRVLSGEESGCDFTTVAKIADALGASINFECADMNEIRRRQAERKAERIVGMVQGTMGLEAQAVGDETVCELKQRTVRDLLAGSSRKLWDE
jgi:hypothetical protein